MPYETTYEQTRYKNTRFTFLQVCNRYFGPKARTFSYLDQQSFTLAAGSNCAANTTTEFQISLPLGTLLDTIVCNPTAAMPAGLAIVGSYVNLASIGQGAQGQTQTPGTFKVRFANLTGASIDAAGTYTYFQAGR